MNENISSNVPPVPDDEIDLMALAKTVWKGRKTILWCVAIGAVLGLLFALFSPKEYTVTCSLVPQTSSGGSKLGGLSDLAAMAGFNVGSTSTSTELSPVIYPQIVQSVPFQRELMRLPLQFEKEPKPRSLYDYYTDSTKISPLAVVKKYTLGLPGVILKAIRGKKKPTKTASVPGAPITLTEKEADVRKIVAKKVQLMVNSKEGYLTLTTTLSEAQATADLAQHAVNLLQKYITQFKIEKATDNLRFVEDRYAEKKRDFERAQNNLASFRDRNQFVSTAMAGTQQERLQSEYTIASTIYTELAKQLEQAKIKVKEDTPVFSVIEPVVVPNQKSKPNKPMILAIWIFLGGVVGIGIVFGRGYVKTLKSSWVEEEVEH